ncbi:MAG: IPT/TIG domain-containing protein, partial [Planctomycetes bacterium]|nr:IPT/TIG domain-containing protein [Planctomycetota bacterium]
VWIDGVPASIVFASTTLIQADTSALPIGGPYDLEIRRFILFTGWVLVDAAPASITVSGPLVVSNVDPAVILQGTTQPLIVHGAGFREVTEFDLFSPATGTWSVDTGTFVDATERQIYVSGGVPAGVYAVRATDNAPGGGSIVASLADGLIISPPLSVASFSPQEVSYLGQTTCTVLGGGFTPSSTVWLDGTAIPTLFVSTTELHCQPPPSLELPTSPLLSVTVLDPITGSVTIPDAMRYRGPLAVNHNDDPVVLATDPMLQIGLDGDGFVPGMTVEIAGVMASVVSGDVTHAEATFPSLPVGVHDIVVSVTVPGESPWTVTATLADGITVAADSVPSIIAVEPNVVCSDEPTPVLIVGANLIPETDLSLGGVVLSTAAVSRDGTNLYATIPPGLPTGPIVLEVSDFRGSSAVSDILEVTGTCATLLPPEELEAARAYGVARFSWHNPEPYDFIDIFDASGVLVATLPGDTTQFELDTTADVVELELQGRTVSAISPVVAAKALAHDCEYPPPHSGAAAPGGLDMALRGGHAPADVIRCESDGPIIPSIREHFPQADRPGSATIGFIFPAAIAHLITRDELRIGFTLDEPVERLEFRAFYQRIAGDFGVSLRGRLVQVFPADGFVDEFTFPDPFIGAPKAFHEVTYYRATDDVSAPDAQACVDASGEVLAIPAGEYRLEIYTVGGDPAVPYYLFADDPRDRESFIAGVPCPPYPLVEVRDLTGLRTLPNVTAVVVEETVQGAGLGVAARVSARGTWFDFDGDEYSIDPYCDSRFLATTLLGTLTIGCNDPPYRPNDSFQFSWTVHSEEPAVTKFDGPEPWLQLPSWGCYKIELTITDLACGTSRTFQRDVAIFDATGDLCDGDPFSFRYPSPKPSTVEGIVGLAGLPGSGSFQGERPLEFQVLVVPECYCGSSGPCEAAELGDIEFSLALGYFALGSLQYATLSGSTFTVEDLCPDVFEGPKYFHLSMDDLGVVGTHPLLSSSQPRSVYLMGRATGASTHPWRPIGAPLRIFSPPEVLSSGAPWEGYFDPEAVEYGFTVKSDNDSVKTFPLPDTESMSFGLVDAGIEPTTGNVFDAGFSSAFTLNGVNWAAEVGVGLTGGDVMDNLIGGAPDVVEGVELPRLPDDPPAWEYCSNRTLFKQEFSQTLFESIIYAG